MMTEVWKFRVPLEDVRDYTKVRMIKGAKILHAGNQNEDLCFWCLVNPKETKEEIRNFRVAGTGHPIEDRFLNFVGTVLFREGSLVLHVFEEVD